ncbi:hypothetical protein LTR50_007616 [Elasticomyces elasticus]|nr:hypothetical protein LTR50_007616 [Elasticomyces elasticus]
MQYSVLLSNLFRFLLPPALLFTTYLYLYPAIQGCAFPNPEYERTETTCWLDRSKPGQQSAYANAAKKDVSVAPFRLLALGDPQLEGDSSLPDSNAATFPSLYGLGQDFGNFSIWDVPTILKDTLIDLVTEDVPSLLQLYRKRLDLWGNDYYLAHIYRTVHWWTAPTHVTVLGDLLGSQWVSDEEFERRSERFWKRVFKRSERVSEKIFTSSMTETLGEDGAWNGRVINVAGNHDIGYAGDIDEHRIERFERAFGKVNWDIRFQLLPNKPATSSATSTAAPFFPPPHQPPELRIVVLNSMNLDTPPHNSALQAETYDFINSLIASSRPVGDRTHATILLTHIPLHKEAGVCVDGPFFDFFASDGGGGIKEQNHLSVHTSRGILEGVFGMSAEEDKPAGGRGRNGIIITGHDHEGCDVYHYVNRSAAADGSDGEAWKAARWRQVRHLARDEYVPGVREITVRSMMGDFGGNTGLLSAWFDGAVNEWRFEYSTCLLGVQHIWWAVHILDVVVLLLVSESYVLTACLSKGTQNPLRSRRSNKWTKKVIRRYKAIARCMVDIKAGPKQDL